MNDLTAKAIAIADQFNAIDLDIDAAIVYALAGIAEELQKINERAELEAERADWFADNEKADVIGYWPADNTNDE